MRSQMNIFQKKIITLKKELECIKLTFIEDLLLKLIYFYRENKLKEKVHSTV